MNKKAALIFSLAFFSANAVNAATVLPGPGDTTNEPAKPMPIKVESETEVAEETKEAASPTEIGFGTIQIGTRISYTSLTDGDSGHKGGLHGSGTHLGTIYGLEEEQNFAPVHFFGRFFFSKYVGVELAYDTVEAETQATTRGTGKWKSDGNVTASGPTISIVGQYPNDTKFTPYAQIGVGFYSGSFDESDHWGLGYYDQYEYAAHGSTGQPLNGVTRSIEVDSTTGITLGAGCMYSITDNWLLDMSVQYTKLDMDATAWSYVNGVRSGAPADGHFPMDNLQLRLGIAYQF